MRRKGLGRGLDALLPPGDRPEPGDDTGLRVVAIDAIDPNPRQPRRRFDNAALDELVASMRSLGVLQPLLVRDGGGGRYELVAGERRLRAARLAGITDVPVMVVETDDQGSLERALVENLHREDLNPIEEATAYKELLETSGLTQEALGDKLGRSRAAVTNALRLLDLPLDVQQALADRRLSGAHGRVLLTLQNNPFQRRLAQRVLHEGLTVRETEEVARRYRAMSAPTGEEAKGGRPARPALVSDSQRRLADHLQTRVRVEFGARKGRIVIDVASLEELERVLGVMTGSAPGAQTHVAAPE